MSQFADPAKLENAKAQYQAVLGEIRVAKEDLEDFIVRRDVARENLEKVLIELDKSRGDVAFTEKKRTELYIRIEDATKELKEIEQEIRDSEAGFEKTKVRLSKDIAALEGIISVRREVLSSTEQGIVELASKFHTTYKEIETLMKELDKIVERVKDAKQELDVVENTLSDAQNRASIELKELEGRVVAARALAAQEEAKIVSYEEHVAKDKKNLARRESDLLIKQRRYDQLFKKLYVGH